MKRAVCLIVALYACFCSVFAWNAESFLGDGLDTYQPYELEPVVDPVSDPAQVPMMLSLDDGIALASDTTESSVSSVSIMDLFSNGLYSLNRDEAYPTLSLYNPPTTIAGVEYDGFYYPEQIGSIPLTGSITSTGSFRFCNEAFTIPSEVSGDELDSFYWPFFLEVLDSGDNHLEITFDVSRYNSSAISFDGIFKLDYGIWRTSYSSVVYPGFSIYVDGSLVKSFVGNGASGVDLGGFLFSASQPIQSVSFVFDADLALGYDPGSYYFSITYSASSTASLSFLSDNSVLINSVGDAQNSINDHNSIESEWTGSMTENFNKLDLSGFTYPDGLVAGFALITGIFNDLWNGMGEYKILYVFPLTLGVVLLLIGRISKFSGRGSTSRSGKGDDSA